MQFIGSPNADERFRVGVSIRSRTLSVADLSDAVALFGSDWKGKARELRPHLRSGVPEELGVAFHSHLVDESPEHASDNFLIATSALSALPVRDLSSKDPQVAADIHVMQDLPNHGPVKPIHLTADAVHALATEMHRSEFDLDIDQYGASGFAVVNALFNPLLEKRNLPAERVGLAIRLASGSGMEKNFERLIPDPYDIGPQIDQLTAEISNWERSLLNSARVPGGSCTIDQRLPLYNAVGPGLHFHRALFELLDTHHCDLRIQTHIGPALIYRKIRTAKLPILSTAD